MRVDSLKNTAEFDFIYRNAPHFFHRHFVLYALSFQDTSHRLQKSHKVFYQIATREACVIIGLSISKKIGKAHIRNLLKRRIRAIIYENHTLFKSHALIVVARKDITTSDFHSLQKNLLYAFGKILKMHKPSRHNPTQCNLSKSHRQYITPKTKKYQ